jgi:hypothetical protein
VLYIALFNAILRAGNSGLELWRDLGVCCSMHSAGGFVLGIQALQRIAEPTNVGPVVASLASDAACCITGDTAPGSTAALSSDAFYP